MVIALPRAKLSPVHPLSQHLLQRHHPLLPSATLSQQILRSVSKSFAQSANPSLSQQILRSVSKSFAQSANPSLSQQILRSVSKISRIGWLSESIGWLSEAETNLPESNPPLMRFILTLRQLMQQISIPRHQRLFLFPAPALHLLLPVKRIRDATLF